MKLILSVFLISAPAFASGGFECNSLDKTIRVSGGHSSAGIWVQEVELNGKKLEKQKQFTAEQVYLGDRAFNFLIMDENYNNTLVEVETIRRGFSSAGMAVEGSDPARDDNAKAIVCEFLY